jgi:hypothetical protein
VILALLEHILGSYLRIAFPHPAIPYSHMKLFGSPFHGVKISRSIYHPPVPDLHFSCTAFRFSNGYVVDSHSRTFRWSFSDKINLYGPPCRSRSFLPPIFLLIVLISSLLFLLSTLISTSLSTTQSQTAPPQAASFEKWSASIEHGR